MFCQFTFHALKIKDALQEVLGGENLAICTKVLDQFETYHFAQVGKRISETVRQFVIRHSDR